MTVLSDARQFPASVRSLFMVGTVAIAAIASGATVPDTQESKVAILADVAQVHVMTRNVYDGIEPSDYGNLSTCKDLVGELKQTLASITATDPVARAALHASQIARENPDLLAIQEAVFAQENGNPKVDMLSDLVAELRNRRTPYRIIVAMKGLDTGTVETGRGTSILFSIWDAILVRSDLPAQDIVVDDHEQGLYKLSKNAMLIPTTASDPNDLLQPCANNSQHPGANMNHRRNWMFVDMHLRGHAFRFVTTHLDLDSDSAKEQAKELLEFVGNTRLPVIVTGDFNFAYDEFPNLAAADYRDAWIEGDGATTCCQDKAKTGCTWGPYPKNSPWTRLEKIDLILLRGGVSAINVRLVGAEAPPCSGQGSALLASDHAGVVAGLVFTSAINSSLVWLLIAIGGMLLFAGLLLGVSRWLRRGR